MPIPGDFGNQDVWRAITRVLQMEDVNGTSFQDQDVPQWDATQGQFIGVPLAGGGGFWSRDATTVGAEFLFPFTATDPVRLGSAAGFSPAAQLAITPTVPTRLGFAIQGANGQSADYGQFLDVDGVVETRFLPGGHLALVGELRFNEHVLNGPSYVGFQAPASLTGSTVWTLPESDGLDGQALFTDGVGQLTWGDVLTPNGPFVTLSPTTSGRNVVVPTDDNVVALTLDHSSANNAPGDVFRLQIDGLTRTRFTENNANDNTQGYTLRLEGENNAYTALSAPIAGEASQAVGVLDTYYDNAGVIHSSRISKGGFFYGAAVGGLTYNLGTDVTTYYTHIAFVAGNHQAVSYPFWMLAGAGISFFSPTSAHDVAMGTQTSGTLFIGNPSNNTTLAANLGLLAGSWVENRRALEIQDPSGAPRSYFGAYGNLVLHPNNVNGGVGWDNTVPLQINFEPATALAANAIEFQINSTTLWNVTAVGDTAMRGELRLLETVANGANFVGFKAPAVLGANTIWTLPAVDGTNGQTLLTNGAGVLSWGAGAGGTDLTGAVILAPDSTARNRVIPINANISPLILRGAASQAADLLQLQDSQPITVARFDAAGKVYVPNARINSFTALLKGVGGDVTPAVAGTDYEAALGQPSQNGAVLSSTITGVRSWIPPPTTDLSGAVILAPLTSSRNVVITADAAVTPLTLQSSASPTAVLLRLQESSSEVAQFQPGGQLWLQRELRFGTTAGPSSFWLSLKAPTLAATTAWTLPGADGTNGQVLATDGGGTLFWTTVNSSSDLTGAVILAPSSSIRNRVIPTGDFIAFILRGSASQTVDLQQWQETGGGVLGAVGPTGSALFRPRDGGTTSASIALTLGHKTTAALASIGAGFGGEIRFTADSTGLADRPAGSLLWSWADALDSQRRARLTLNAYDWIAPREGLRIESDGAQALLGIGGSTLTGVRTILYSGTAGTIGLILRQAGSPTANPFQIDDSGGVPLARFDATGKIFVPNARINTFSGILKGVAGDVTTATAQVDYESALGNPASDGYLLSSTALGGRSWIPAPVSGNTFWSRNTSVGGEEFLFATTATDKVVIGSASDAPASAQAFIKSTASTRRGLLIQGAVGQTGHLLEFRNSSNQVYSYFESDGRLLLQDDGTGLATFASFQINSTSTAVLLPRLTTTQRGAISAPVEGMLLYNTIGHLFQYYNGTAWTDMSAADLSAAVILAPGASTRNVVQPTGDFLPLALKGFSGQTANLLEIRDSANAQLLNVPPGGHLWVGRELRLGELVGNGANYVGFKASDALSANTIWTLPTGDGSNGQVLTTNGGAALSWTTITAGAADLSAAVILAPNSSARNVVVPTGDFISLLLRGNSGQTVDLQQWQETGSAVLGSVSSSGAALFRPRDSATTATTIALTLGHKTTAALASVGAGFGGEIRFNGDSTSTVDRAMGGLLWLWATATDASRAARMVWNVNDATAAREGLRLEASGNLALLGIGGAILTNTRATLYPGAAGVKGLVIQMAATPTANPFEIQSSTPALLANFDPTGKIFVPNARINSFSGMLKAVGGDVTTAAAGSDYVDPTALAGYVILAPTTSARNVVQPTGGAIVPFTLRQQTGQTADLQQWQSTAPAVLAAINALGQHVIGATSTNGHQFRVFQTGNTGSGTDETQPSFLPVTPLWIDQNVTTIDAGGGPDVGGLNLRTLYTATNPAAADLTHTGFDSRLRYGTRASWADATGTAARGTVHSFTSVVDILNSADSSANEFANFMGYARFRGNPGTSGSLWFMDLSAHGPISTQPGLLNGITMLINNYYNGVPTRGPSAAMWLVTQPGAGAGAELGHNTATTFPVEYGLAIIGSSTGGVGFRDAIHIGSGVHPWKPSGTSSLERGLHIEGVTSEAIRMVGGNIGVVWGNESAGGGKMRLDRPALYELQLGNVTDGGLFRVWGREGVVNDPVIEGKTTAVQALALRLQHGAGGTLNSFSMALAAAANQFGTGTASGDSVLRFTNGRLLGGNGTSIHFLFSGGALQLGNAGADPSARAILDLSSTTKGVFIPRMTTTQRNAIVPLAGEFGLTVYDSTVNQFFFWNGSAWVQLQSGSSGSQNWTSTAGVISPTVNTDRVLIRTTTDPGGGISLAVMGNAQSAGSTNDPIAQFYTNNTTDSNSILLKNGTASLKLFVSGASNTFQTGTVVGDTGLIPSNGRFHLGSATASWLKAVNGNIGIGMAAAVDPTSPLDVRGRFTVTSAGTTPDLAYPSPQIITRVASNTAQYLSFVRAATAVWSLGMLPNSSVFAIGGGNATDTSFTALFNLDLQGRMVVGRSGVPNAGMVAEFYSDPVAPKALGVPTWNNVTERDSVAVPTPGMFGYQADNQTLQYRDLAAWRILARTDQLISIHASLLGLDADDHPGSFWMAGRQFVQILIGGTQSDADLVLQSTAHPIKGLILMGSSAYNEATNRLGLRTTNPLYTLDVNGDVRFSTSLTGLLRADNGVISVDTAGLTQVWTRNSGGYLTTTTANDRVLVGNAANVNTLPLLSAFAPSTNNDDIFTVGKGTTRYMVVGNNGGIVMGASGSPVANKMQVNNARLVLTPDNSGVHMETPSVGSAGNVGAVAGYMTLAVGGLNYALPYYNIISAPAVPSAPSGLGLTVISTSQIDLAWTDNSSDETSFRVERSPDGSSFSEISSTAANTPAYSNTVISSATK